MEINSTFNSPGEEIDRLAAQAASCGCRWIRFSEDIVARLELVRPLDLEQLKKEGWFPWTVAGGKATVVTCRPSPELAGAVRETLAVAEVEFVLTRPRDLVRIIEHNQDLNPGFPPSAGRTPLARVRTYLAGRRSHLSLYRTLMAKSRTHLAVVRTGLSFIAIAIVFLRMFSGVAGSAFYLLLLLEASLLFVGVSLVIVHLLKYLPARKLIIPPTCTATIPTFGSTVLQVADPESMPRFHRSAEVPGASALRAGWSLLSPVMRRRFLASDRTDFAEERTTMACFRTWLGNVRTWLAFVRTGGAFIGIGFALFRAFPTSSWVYFDFSLVGLGLLMSSEGLFWYYRGYHAGKTSFRAVLHLNTRETIWDFFFPHRGRGDVPPVLCELPLEKDQAPGIWATTGVALERTVLADRRNIMARLRTVMSRIRTGYSFIRTGLTFFFIGATFAVYFHRTNLFWQSYEAVMMLGGLFLIIDGLFWVIPANRVCKQFPYCSTDLEIIFADYGIPCRFWHKVVFRRDVS